MRVGVAGRNGAGKTEVVRLLERRSFYSTSLSDVIREDLARDGLEPTREHMIERGRSLRERFGAGVLAERALARLAPDRHHVIDSIRHPAEVEMLRGGGEFALLFVDADPRVRLERVRRRGRADERALDLETFLALEARELSGVAPTDQQLLAVEALADHVLRNDGDLARLESALDEWLRARWMFQGRPSWDEYFMSIARVVASRSNCVKRKVGALLVLDRRIISTGYNGTPRGVTNCNEGGCPRCASGAEAGTRLHECLCSHAEENAITQAAYHGVRVRDASLYTTFSPCLICAKMIINAGICEVIYGDPAYGANFVMEEAAAALFRGVGVKTRRA
jgi:dCMP deaminase